MNKGKFTFVGFKEKWGIREGALGHPLCRNFGWLLHLLFEDLTLIATSFYTFGAVSHFHWQIKHLYFPDRNYIYGFILMAKGNSIELYHHEKEVIIQWINALKDSVILVDLKEDYLIG